MSTLTVTNIKKTGETASRDVSGVAAAWINFNGTGTIAIRSSMNVASLTDGGVGLYTMSYASSLANGDYSVGDFSANSGATLSQTYVVSDSWLAAGSYQFYTMYVNNLTGGGGNVDSSVVGVQIMGEMA